MQKTDDRPTQTPASWHKFVQSKPFGKIGFGRPIYFDASKVFRKGTMLCQLYYKEAILGWVESKDCRTADA